MMIRVLDETLELLPERAFLWRKKNMLVFSDVHLGKAESLQAMGVPVPSSVHQEDLDRMTALIHKHCIQEVLILGDWIHKKNSWTPELIQELDSFFRVHDQIKWTLLLGNHERGSLDYLKIFPLKLVENELEIEPFIFSHGHESSSKGFTIQGHVHPVVVLKEGPIRLRLPCFVLENESLLLPSFGTFTGGHEISRSRSQKIFAVTQKEIFEVPSHR